MAHEVGQMCLWQCSMSPAESRLQDTAIDGRERRHREAGKSEEKEEEEEEECRRRRSLFIPHTHTTH